MHRPDCPPLSLTHQSLHFSLFSLPDTRNHRRCSLKPYFGAFFWTHVSGCCGSPAPPRSVSGSASCGETPAPRFGPCRLSASSLSRLGTASDFFAARFSREEPPISPSRIQTAAVVLRQRRSEHLERPRKRACPPSYCADRSCSMSGSEKRGLVTRRLWLQHRRFSSGS